MDVKRYTKGKKLSLRIMGLFMVIALLSGTLLPVGVMAADGDIVVTEEASLPEEYTAPAEEPQEDVPGEGSADEQTPSDEAPDEPETEETSEEEDEVDEVVDIDEVIVGDTEETSNAADESEIPEAAESEESGETPDTASGDDSADQKEVPADDEVPAEPTAPAEEPVEEAPVENETTEAENIETETTEEAADTEEETGSEFKYICGNEEHEHTEDCYPQDDAAAEDEMIWDVPGELTTFFDALSDKASATAEILEFVEGVADALADAMLKITELAVEDIRELFVNYDAVDEIRNYAVFDLGFYLDDVSEVEPGTDVAVTVDLTAYLADQDYDPASLVLYHHEEDEWGVIVDTVPVASYEDGSITVDEAGTVTAAFTVNSFSAFTLAWSNTEEEITAEEEIVEAEEQTFAESYLAQIAELKTEAESLVEPTQEECADIYNRLMEINDEVVAAREEGTITEDEYTTVYNAIGEVVMILYEYGYDPYAVAVTYDTSGTMDHLEVEIYNTVTVEIDGEEHTVKIAVVTQEQYDSLSNKETDRQYIIVEKADFTVTASQNIEFSYSSITEGDGSTESETVELTGSYPTGTLQSPVYYTITAKIEITVDDLTIPVTLSTTTHYWDFDNNHCPGAAQMAADYWKQGYYIADNNMKSGIDVALTAEQIQLAITTGKLAIEKVVTGTDESVTDSFTFTLMHTGKVMIDGVETDLEGQYATFTNYAYTGSTTDETADAIYITVPANTAITLTDLPAGTYRITEIQSNDEYIIIGADGQEVEGDYTLDYTVTSKTDDAIPVVTFTNKKLENEAAISIKKIASGLPSGDTYPDPTVSIYALDSADGNMLTSAVWTGTLTANGDTLYLTATLEVGTTYIIVEEGEDVDGYDCATTLTGGTNVDGLKFTVTAGTRHDLVVYNEYTEQPKTTSVTISKEVKGNMGDLSKEFEFIVKIVQSDGTKFIPSGYTENTKEDGSEDGTFTVSLKHGETITFTDVPIGSTITVAEQDFGESAIHKVYINGNTEADDDGKYEVTLTNDTAITIAYINEYEATIDTAVSLDSLPYIILFAVVGTGVVLTAAEKRRTLDE